MADTDQALAERIAAHADAIARRSTARMYEDPFWDARFGARGRRYAEEDGRHHVDHLVLALQVGHAGPLAQYARWLRVVLTTRGMCSRHIEQHFSRLGEALADAGIDGGERVRALLAEATRALRPELSAASVLCDARSAIADGAHRRFAAAHGEWVAPGDGREPGSTADDLETMASFLCDAIALDRPEVLGKHAAWLAGWSTERGRDAGYVAGLLDAIGEALADAVPDESARAAGRAMLSAARATLA